MLGESNVPSRVPLNGSFCFKIEPCFSYTLSTLLRLKEASDARTLCVSIEGVEGSQDLITALQGHAQQMTDIYRQLTQKISANVNEEGVYKGLFELAAEKAAWYKSRKKVANSMKAASLAAAPTA